MKTKGHFPFKPDCHQGNKNPGSVPLFYMELGMEEFMTQVSRRDLNKPIL